MGENSKIEWTHHTFNPWWGCTKVSPACDHCYAETWAKRCGLNVWGKYSERRFFGEKHWNEPLMWDRAAEKAGERHRVFCSSMADIMEDRTDLDTPRIALWRLIEQTPHLYWLLLTKRPRNFRRFLPPAWLENPRANVWLLTTVESNQSMWRVESLLEVRAVVHGVSYEPALGPADFSPYLPNPAIRRTLNGHSLPSLSWVIAGGESGANARPPHPNWIRRVRDDCASAGVPFLFKQWGEWRPEGPMLRLRPGRVWNRGEAIVCPHSGDIRGMESLIDKNTWLMRKVGKKAAGRELDGRIHDQYPERVISEASK